MSSRSASDVDSEEGLRRRRGPNHSVGRHRQVPTIKEELIEGTSSEDEQLGINIQGEMKFVKKDRTYDNEYDRVCASLQLTAVPDVLPCRDKERNIITDFLVNGILNGGSSSSLYISGMPGTGKTATTLEVIKSLTTNPKKHKLTKHPFDFIHINAMALTNPNLVYTVLHEKITGKRSNPTASATFLDDFFKKKDKMKVFKDKGYIQSKMPKKDIDRLYQACSKLRVVLIDELDALVSKKQTLLYNLFDWPCHENSRLLVISIANTMDLPEKLQPKIKSRIGNNRLVYEPYGMEQIAQII